MLCHRKTFFVLQCAEYPSSLTVALSEESQHIVAQNATSGNDSPNLPQVRLEEHRRKIFMWVRTVVIFQYDVDHGKIVSEI